MPVCQQSSRAGVCVLLLQSSCSGVLGTGTRGLAGCWVTIYGLGRAATELSSGVWTCAVAAASDLGHVQDCGLRKAWSWGGVTVASSWEWVSMQQCLPLQGSTAVMAVIASVAKAAGADHWAWHWWAPWNPKLWKLESVCSCQLSPGPLETRVAPDAWPILTVSTSLFCS